MFKPGERIRCLESYRDQFTKDKIYVVTDISGLHVSILKDDKGKPNGWVSKAFRRCEKELFYQEVLKD